MKKSKEYPYNLQKKPDSKPPFGKEGISEHKCWEFRGRPVYLVVESILDLGARNNGHLRVCAWCCLIDPRNLFNPTPFSPPQPCSYNQETTAYAGPLATLLCSVMILIHIGPRALESPNRNLDVDT